MTAMGREHSLRARYYDPGIGRFTQMDDWEGSTNDVITLNKYIYANADSANGIDPSGNMTLIQNMAAISGLGILLTTTIQTPKLFGSTNENGYLTDRQKGLLELFTYGVSKRLFALSFSYARDDSAEADKADIDVITSTEIISTGSGRYKVLTKCQVKKAGQPERAIGYTTGIGFGFGSTLPQAVTNAQASVNSRCVRGTQARHCKARKCWKGKVPIPCPRGNN